MNLPSRPMIGRLQAGAADIDARMRLALDVALTGFAAMFLLRCHHQVQGAC